MAVKVPLWPSLTKGRLSAQVDRIVVRVDADAVRRRKERAVDRDVWIGDVDDVPVPLASGLARHATGTTIDINGASYVR